MRFLIQRQPDPHLIHIKQRIAMLPFKTVYKVLTS